MGPFAFAYISALLVMAGLDFVWLSVAGGPIYRSALGAMMTEQPSWAAAIAFYLLYGMGLVLFAVRPALSSGEWRTGFLWGALFGFFAYATYDLTNLATLKIWSLKVSLIDMAWGALLSGVSAAVAAWAALSLAK
jgi:uncharacterized membrane protein